MSDSRVEFYVLGGVELRGVDARQAGAVMGQPKVAGLLAFLAMAPQRRPQLRDRLVGVFWPELDQTHARTALRKAVHVLRKTFGNDTIVGRGEEDVALNPAFWCDATEFARACNNSQMGRALELYAGDLMPGFYLTDCTEFERWLDAERATLRAEAAAAALAMAALQEDENNLSLAGRIARKAVTIKWDDERVLRRAMQLLTRIGDNAGALRVYNDFSERMRRELAASPSEESRKLADSLRG